MNLLKTGNYLNRSPFLPGGGGAVAGKKFFLTVPAAGYYKYTEFRGERVCKEKIGAIRQRL
jgi:hypothetical protein